MIVSETEKGSKMCNASSRREETIVSPFISSFVASSTLKDDADEPSEAKATVSSASSSECSSPVVMRANDNEESHPFYRPRGSDHSDGVMPVAASNERNENLLRWLNGEGERDAREDGPGKFMELSKSKLQEKGLPRKTTTTAAAAAATTTTTSPSGGAGSSSASWALPPSGGTSQSGLPVECKYPATLSSCPSWPPKTTAAAAHSRGETECDQHSAAASLSSPAQGMRLVAQEGQIDTQGPSYVPTSPFPANSMSPLMPRAMVDLTDLTAAAVCALPSPVLAHTKRLKVIRTRSRLGRTGGADAIEEDVEEEEAPLMPIVRPRVDDHDPLTMESSDEESSDATTDWFLPFGLRDCDYESGNRFFRPQEEAPIRDAIAAAAAAEPTPQLCARYELHHERRPTTIFEELGEVYEEEDEDDDEKEEEEKLEDSTSEVTSASGASANNHTDRGKTHSSGNDLVGMQIFSPVSSCADLAGCFSPLLSNKQAAQSPSGSSGHGDEEDDFAPHYSSTSLYGTLSRFLLSGHYGQPFAAATWIGFWALLHATCANHVLTPMRDAIALQIGVEHIPKLTLASTALAFCSSVPIGWLFEAPDPNRRKFFKRIGLTRGETQGTSLALFYRLFALSLLFFAVGFELIEYFREHRAGEGDAKEETTPTESQRYWRQHLTTLWTALGYLVYIGFFLGSHLMKLHSVSLVWGVTTEAMDYEQVASNKRSEAATGWTKKTRVQKLALVSFGGTIGGMLGSFLASSMAQMLRISGLLLLAAVLLEVSAELSVELGRVMQSHWEEQQQFQSSNDLASLDSSMKRSSSLGSMKRVASGNSLNRSKSANELTCRSRSLTGTVISTTTTGGTKADGPPLPPPPPEDESKDDDTFAQRLLRGIKTIMSSRLLMAIFTYNALYASTTVLLSFQRAALVANRNNSNSKESDTAFLANVSLASSLAIFALQASGLGAAVAQMCGPRGTLSLMPLIRLVGVLALAWWHRASQGRPPNLLVFLVVDECTKIMNLAVAKPVRESLWAGLSNEARYEAKPIVDTLANRWGGGSAAFLVSVINKALESLDVQPGADGSRSLLGFPPVIFLCVCIAAWWTAASANLGQVRRRIDMELKKVQ